MSAPEARSPTFEKFVLNIRTYIVAQDWVKRFRLYYIEKLWLNSLLS